MTYILTLNLDSEPIEFFILFLTLGSARVASGSLKGKAVHKWTTARSAPLAAARTPPLPCRRARMEPQATGSAYAPSIVSLPSSDDDSSSARAAVASARRQASIAAPEGITKPASLSAAVTVAAWSTATSRQ